MSKPHDEDDMSEASIKESQGEDGQNVIVSWNGCVCGTIHARPKPVFWIQCDGVCQGWYNVSPECVGGLSPEPAARIEWECRKCKENRRSQPMLHTLIDLPQDVWIRILTFCGKNRCAVLGQTLAPVSKTLNLFFQGRKSRCVWNAILQQEQQLISQNSDEVTPRRKSLKRRRTCYDDQIADDLSNPRLILKEKYLALASRTEDALGTIEAHADLRPRLNPTLFRKITKQYAPIDWNRRSPCSGRTLLQICCAAEMDQGGIVACVQNALNQGADPNVYSSHEHPYANRPAIFFAIARVMPKVVALLLDAKAGREVRVSGSFRLTFDTTKTISGTFTPLEYAHAMRRAEKFPPYWVKQSNEVIEVLERRDME